METKTGAPARAAVFARSKIERLMSPSRVSIARPPRRLCTRRAISSVRSFSSRPCVPRTPEAVDRPAGSRPPWPGSRTTKVCMGSVEAVIVPRGIAPRSEPAMIDWPLPDRSFRQRHQPMLAALDALVLDRRQPRTQDEVAAGSDRRRRIEALVGEHRELEVRGAMLRVECDDVS